MACYVLGGILISSLNGGCERGDGTGLVVRDVLYSVWWFGPVLYGVIIGALGCERLAGKNNLM